jgi:hypothetical protein
LESRQDCGGQLCRYETLMKKANSCQFGNFCEFTQIAMEIRNGAWYNYHKERAIPLFHERSEPYEVYLHLQEDPPERFH